MNPLADTSHIFATVHLLALVLVMFSVSLHLVVMSVVASSTESLVMALVESLLVCTELALVQHTSHVDLAVADRDLLRRHGMCLTWHIRHA